jgi:hypothetical protein
MRRELLNHLHSYFLNIEKPTEDEKSILAQLTGELPHFPITHVCRNDLTSKGFDVAGVSDADMVRLADKMSDDYQEQLYWESMKIIAMDSIGIPLLPMPYCPICKSEFYTDPVSGKYVCGSCGQKWSDNYVLVQHPEDSSHFNNEDIGYPCFNSEDNGASYVPEYEYIRHFKKSPTTKNIFTPLPWPESQNFLHHSDKRCEVVMADEKALKDFGGSAVWVPVELLDIETATDNEAYNQ